MDDAKLLERITYSPEIFGRKPIVRRRRLAVEHVLGMLAAGHTRENMLEDFPWLEPEDFHACLLYEARIASRE